MIYYVNNLGNDASTGTSEATAWKTISKVASTNFSAGDTILFKRGDIFTGTLTPRSGVSGNVITYSAYGTGNKPVFDGFETLTGWTNAGNGIYSAATTALDSYYVNIVTVDGVNTGKGRFPKTGYLTYEAHTSNTSIRDNQLTGTPNWLGATIALRAVRWAIYPSIIRSHDVSTLTFDAVSDTPNDGYGYFLQDSSIALTQLGDWYISGGRFYMYFGAVDPNTKVVKVSTTTRLVTNTSAKTYFTLDNIKFTGANEAAIKSYNQVGMSVTNCDFYQCGINGIEADGNLSNNSITINNCAFDDINTCAIHSYATYTTITNCTITNIGLIPGMGLPGWGNYSGILSAGNNGTINNNRISNVGYNGIRFKGDLSNVSYNSINGYCGVLDDGGGIYTAIEGTGRIIDHNILLNARNASDGTNSTAGATFSIYIDEQGHDVSIMYNTVYKGTGGILLHSAKNIDINNNTVYDCDKGMYFSHNTVMSPTNLANGINLNNNTFVAKTSLQYPLSFISNYNDLLFGSANNNIYSRPINEANTFSVDTYNTSTTYYDLAGWKTLTGYDTNSIKSPRTLPSNTEIFFDYNDTSTAKTVSLDGNFVDMRNNLYQGSITIQPFSSVLLLRYLAYYVSTSGSDSSNGMYPSTAWKTLNKVSTATLVAGDTILFNKDNVFDGSLAVKSGAINNNITYSSYGTGENPIISGFSLISNWTNLGSGIYSATTTAQNTANCVTINGVNTPKGRYPKNDYLLSDTRTINTLKDSSINGVDWLGAEVVIRTNSYIFETKTITQQVDSSISFSNLVQSPSQPGYFFQNDLKCLTEFGDWCIKDGTFYMYFGTEFPTNYTIKVSVVNEPIYINTKSYININNLVIEGANSNSVTIFNGSDINIYNCTIKNGNNGIYSTCSSLNVYNNNFSNLNGTAILAAGTNAIIYNNQLDNIAINEGHVGLYRTSAIYSTKDNTKISYNKINNCGYNGIHFIGNTYDVSRNYVNNFCTILTDGGAIYTDGKAATYTGQLIRNNVILNGIYNSSGTTLTESGTVGIYIDEKGENVTASYNTIGNIDGYGILLHSCRNDNILYNNVYNCTLSQLVLSHNTTAPNQSGIVINNNKFIAKEPLQKTMRQYSTYDDYLFGSANNNVYARPIDDSNTISIENLATWNSPSATHDLAWWKSYSGYDASSYKSTKSIQSTDEILFLYNDTSINKVSSLNGRYTNVSGTATYTSTITLLPYESEILLKLGIYYVSSIGTDTSLGTDPSTAWKSLSKITGTTFVNGDTILFKKGDIFTGNLTLSKSSTSGSPITYGAFGTGNNPVITSLYDVSTWVLHSGNIYKSTIAIPANCNIVTVDGVNTEMGKYPMNGYNYFESWTFTIKYIASISNYSGTIPGTVLVNSIGHGITNGAMINIHDTTNYNGYYQAGLVDSSNFYITKGYYGNQTGTICYNTTITDTQLTNTPNFTGAELVLYKSNWTIDRSLVTNHTNSVVTYSTGSAWTVQGSGEYKYFFQKSLNCLLKNYDWFADGSTFYMYFSNNDPSSHSIKAGMYDHTIKLDRKNYNTLSNLNIEGGNLYGVYCISSVGLSVIDCSIYNSGVTGLTAITNASTGASTNTLVQNCNVHDTNGNGMWINSASSRVYDSSFYNCGLFTGMGDPGGASHGGLYIKGVGNIIEYNTFNNIGYIPISWESINVIVRNNVVENYPTQGLVDGGGIYSFSSTPNQSGQKVYNNIIRNSAANGLYSDGISNHIEFYNNTVYDVSKWGIHMNEPVGNIVRNNNFKGANRGGIDISNQYYNQWVAADNSIYNNIIVQGNPSDNFYSIQDGSNNNVVNFGYSNYNTFVGSTLNTKGFYNSYVFPSWHTDYLSFASWKTLTGEDSSSLLKTYDLANVEMHVNDTSVVKTITLSGTYNDLDGNVISNILNLDPFTSVFVIQTAVARRILIYNNQLLTYNGYMLDIL